MLSFTPRVTALRPPAEPATGRDTSAPGTAQPRRGRARRTGAALHAAAPAACLLAAGTPAPAGPLGLGDPLYPHLGNPGYDVRAYDISLAYQGAHDKPI